MFTNNKFAKMDSIANLINTILETDTKAKMEELKGNQHKIDKNKNNKIDAHDFAILRGQKKGMKEEAEQVDEASHQAKTTMKHITNPTAGEKKAAKDIKPGVAGYRDRIAMLKSAEARGALKKEEAEQVDEAYTLKLTKTTHPKDVTDDEDQPVKATEKHYDVHQGGKKVGEVKHHHNEYGGHFYRATLHGKKVPYDRHNGPGEGAKAFIDGVAKTKWHSKNIKEEAEQVDEARVKGKGYDNPENERKAPEGHVSMTSLMPGHDERAAKFLARQAKGKLVKGKAQSAPQKEEVEQMDEAVALSDAKTTAERLVKKTIATHGIANPRTASDHAKNAHAIEKTLDRASVARSPAHLANAHSDVKTVSAATRRHNVALNMSGAERKAHKTLQAGVVKHLQKHLDQHKQAFQNAAAKYASKNKTNEEYTIEDIENFMQTEEYQQLDELSKNLLSRYKKAAEKDQYDAFDKDNKLGIEHQKVKRLMANTNKGAPGMRGANPISKTNAPAVHKALSKASDEIQKMRDPHQARFAKRRSGMELATKKMGIGAGSRGVVRGTGKLNKEEVEQIDELSVDTLVNYKRAAAKSIAYGDVDYKKDPNKFMKRLQGTVNARKKINKFVLKQEEQVDERTMSAPETAEKERIVKGMKKNLAGFKQRYGERAKNVMYATATKQAMKSEEVDEKKK